MESELNLRIVLEKPTAGVDFGLQKGCGNDYETLLSVKYHLLFTIYDLIFVVLVAGWFYLALFSPASNGPG